MYCMCSWVYIENFTVSIVCASCLNIYARLHAECACRHNSVRHSIGCSGNLVWLILTFLPLLLYIPPPSPSFFTFHLPPLLSLRSTFLPFFLYIPPPSTSHPLNLYIPPFSLYFFIPPFSIFFPFIPSPF